MDDINLLLGYITPEQTTESNTGIETDQTKLETALAQFKAAKEAQ
jgi:hypothetical protein